jgi:hypothetical protein
MRKKKAYLVVALPKDDRFKKLICTKVRSWHKKFPNPAILPM